VERAYTDGELDAALAALSEEGRLREAQRLVARAAPQLHRVLDEALAAGGWFGETHAQAVAAAADVADPAGRRQAVDTLVSEETRLGMLVGVAVGFELARTLEAGTSSTEGE
jgi:NAD(P)-dependent dehydrogenase (short-subunit alcohol dehydrogenase family)